jgi:DNA topoisomerase-2
LEEFYQVRLEMYRRRREHLLILLQVEQKRAQNKMRFIRAVTDGKMRLYNQPKSKLMDLLREEGYETSLELLPKLPLYRHALDTKPYKYTNSIQLPKDAPLEADSYDYLLQLPLSSLTAERLKSLQHEQDTATAQLEQLRKSDAKSLWLHDLDKFEQEWEQMEKKRRQAANGGGKRTIEAEFTDEDDE